MTRRAFPPAHPDIADVLREVPSIRRALQRRGVLADDVDDLAQDVLLAALVAIAEHRYRPDPRVDQLRALRSWLCTIARNLAGHLLCSARVRLEVVTDPGWLPESQGSDVAVMIDVRRGLGLLGRLRPERRAVLEAVAMGRRIPEIARALGAPEPTVWTRLRLGRRDLKAALRRAGARGR